MSDNDQFIVVEGGIVSNETGLPVFDMGTLGDGDLEGAIEFYDRLTRFAKTQVKTSEIKLKELPCFLREAIVRTELMLGAELVLDREFFAIARDDAAMRSELIDFSRTEAIGPCMGQYFARLVLGQLGIEWPQGLELRLTDVEPETTDEYHSVNPSQLAYAVEQYVLATSDAIDADVLEGSLEWV